MRVPTVESTHAGGACTANRVLVVEDDAKVAHEIVSALGEHGFSVELAGTGGVGLQQMLHGQFDCVVLDRLLPEIDGMSILTTARNVGIKTPVLMLSALGATDERVRGLRNGADDYLTKPFSFDELTARIDVLLRRHNDTDVSATLRVGDLHLDSHNGTVTRAGVPVVLKPREMRLLEYLMRNANQVVTRALLFESVWKYQHDVQTNVIDVHIARLRKKISLDGACSAMIDTVRGTGYVLHAND
ncbi:DNA-binding response regulator [Pandoraea iniqua]|uniref:DNA-binding response regulator n=1 Tax=Pandoraea iniqua TaxID=2508288 RepID=A0A5E4XK26_9BURK|nr:response regulator transcription factor [Pandoraea iniqua]VVE36614.1 DNA-binding response regulator [Pandoraea iniqua]